MSDARAIFCARLALWLSFAGMLSAFVPCLMCIWNPDVYSTPWTAFTPIGIVLTWGSIYVSLVLTRRQLRQTQDRLLKALEENVALKEGQLRLRSGEPGDHDRKGILT